MIKTKIISLMLVVLLILSTGLTTACKNRKVDKNVNDYELDVEGSKREEKITETDKYILKNGASEYAVVVSENAKQDELSAALELISFFSESTGVLLPRKTDKELTYSDTAKYISIGNNDILDAAGLTLKGDLNTSGFNIRTKNQSIFVYGKTERGTLYGIYSLLQYILNYEYIFDDTYAIDKSVKDIKLMNYDVVDQADIEYNESDNLYIQNFSRYRMVRRNALTIPIDGSTGHNILKYVPVEIYGESDWEFYSSDKGSISFTANGNPEKLEKLYGIVLDKMKAAVREFPDRLYIPFIMEDKWSACTHQSSIDIINRHYNKADSAPMIIFLNEIRKRLDEWFDDTGENGGSAYNSDIKIMFYAYFNYLKAPVRLNEQTGKYEVANDEVILRDGIVPLIAPIDADYTKPFTDAINSEYAEHFHAWSSISKELMFYSYDSNYVSQLLPYNSFGAIQNYYQFSKTYNISYMFYHGASSLGGHPTGFRTLRDYLKSKFGWNVNANYKELVNKFFEVYFMDAETPMRKYYEEYRLHAAELESEGKYTGAKNIWTNALRAEWFSKPVLEKWLSYTDEALNLIEKYKVSDPVLYKRLYRHVGGERLFLQYALVELYDAKIEQNRLYQMKKQFKDYCNIYGTNMVAPKVGIETLFQKWGI